MKWLPCGLVALAALIPTTVRAEGETQVWDTFLGLYREPAGGIAGWLDLQVRRRSGSTQMIIRPAIGWGFGKYLTVYGGYAYIPTFVDDGPNIVEQRIWEQAVVNYPVGDALKLQGRLRVEQRFGEGDIVGHRIRVAGRAQYTPSAEVPLQLVVADEVFIGLNDTDFGPTSGFDQNRAFFGLGADTSIKGLRVEAGYMNIAFGTGRIDHVIVVNVVLNVSP